MPKKYKHTKYFTFEGHRYVVRADTLDELYEKKAKKLQELKDGGKLVNQNMTFAAWADLCMKTYKTGIAETTYTSIVSNVRSCILPLLGNMAMKDIKPVHCQTCLNQQAGCSNKHIIRIQNLMKYIFARAVDNNIIRKNPAENLSRPKGYTHTRRALSRAERESFSKVVLSSRRFYVFALMLFCGCRPIEARRCKGFDLSVKQGVPLLHIRGTKTAYADRYVPVPDVLYQKIKDIPKDEYISYSVRLTPYTEYKKGSFKIAWSAVCKQVNIDMGCKVVRGQLIPPYPLPDDIAPYNLRHEYCTELARQGVNISIAKKLMGHSNIQMTANVYTNLDQDDIINVARDLPGVAVGVADESNKIKQMLHADDNKDCI